MMLSELKFEPVSGTSSLASWHMILADGSVLLVWRNSMPGVYTIQKCPRRKGISVRSFVHVDALTAQCVLNELLGTSGGNDGA